MNRAEISKSLCDYANRIGSGFLTYRKAALMVSTLNDIPDILSDSSRCFLYLENCLLMEGFSHMDIEKINRWVIFHISN